MHRLLQEMGQGDFQPLKAGQQYDAGLSCEPFPALPCPSPERLRRASLRAGGGFNPSGCWLEAALQAWPPTSAAHRGGRGVELRPCTHAGSMDTQGKDDFGATPCSRQHGTVTFQGQDLPTAF